MGNWISEPEAEPKLSGEQFVANLETKRFARSNIEQYRNGSLKVEDIPLSSDIQLRALGDFEKIQEEVTALIPKARCFRCSLNRIEMEFELQNYTELSTLITKPYITNVDYCSLRFHLCV